MDSALWYLLIFLFLEDRVEQIGDGKEDQHAADQPHDDLSRGDGQQVFVQKCRVVVSFVVMCLCRGTVARGMACPRRNAVPAKGLPLFGNANQNYYNIIIEKNQETAKKKLKFTKKCRMHSNLLYL